MICKHVDLIAIGFLLLAMAVFTHARRVVVVSPFGPPRIIIFPPQHPGHVFPAPKMPLFSFHRG
ncbi:MAG TPA: hypothetical protein VK604_27425 [Bryobacteraceae bacterium]|nr:hypothetical protein [Bryobacteraceae bacterium]